MIHLVMVIALVMPDTARCTWEGRLPERGAHQPAVSRPSQMTRLTRVFRTGSKNDRLYAVRSMGAIGDLSAMPVLIEAAADTNKHVSLEAVWALGRMQDSRVAPILLNALRSPDSQVQQAAACGLGRAGNTRSLRALSELLSSTNVFVASAARWSIEQIKSNPGG
ncbi:MAG: HEAT repeat domain-containing protein [Gemmatimonadales bacterium]